jgi:sphingosine kinase
MTRGNHTVKHAIALRKNGSYGSLPRPPSIGSLVTLGECGGGSANATTTLFPGQGVMLARDVSSVRREGCVVVARAHHRGKIGPVIKKKRSARGREYRFAFGDEKDAVRAIGELCAGCGIEETQRGERSGRRRRLFVVVNPKSGKGEGIKIWENKAAWVLASAGFDFDAYVTRAAGEATTLARERFDASRYDGIVAVGGDGTVAEIFQGLNEREDAKETLGKVAIGVVAAGSGNALCKSIQQDADEPCDPVSCALTIARAHTRALDSSVVRFLDSKTGEWSNRKQAHSLLSTSWGFFSDVDIESEKFRFLGGARFTLQAIVRIISRRTYSCEILYETTEEGEDHNERVSRGARGEPVPGRPGWRKIHGDILGLWALNVPWGTESTMAAPFAKFNDGSIDLVVVRPTGRRNMVKLLLAFDAGDHVHNRAVSYLKAKSFEVYPGKCSSTRSGGFIAVDGEVSAQRHDSKSSQAPYGPFRCDVRFAGCRVFAPAPASSA